VANRIKAFTKEEIKEIETKGEITVPLNGNTVTLSRDDVEILSESIEGWLVESEGGLTVALDTELVEELITEGFAREFVNRVQNMRKDAEFKVTDRIRIYYRSSPKLENALRTMAQYIKTETLAVDLINQFQKGDYSETVDINGEGCRIGIERMK